MSSYDLVLAGANIVLSCGNYIFVQIPLRVLNLCWKTQAFLLNLPYCCVQCLLSVLQNSISRIVDPPIRATTKEILEEYLKKENLHREELIKSMQEIRQLSLAAIQRIENFDDELQRCRNKVFEWKTESEKRSKEISSFAKDEKKLLRIVMAALKHLKKLKGTKALFDDKFKHALQDLVNFSRTLSQKSEELSESAEGSPGKINGNLKSAYNRLQQQADLLRDFTDKRQKAFCHVPKTPTSKETKEFVSASSPKQAAISDTDLVSIGMETLQSIVCVLNAENVILKRRLKLTNDQLEDVKSTSKCLSEKVAELEEQLIRVKKLLKVTEEERDEVSFKLLTLHEIIEEQEEFLNASCHEDSMGSIYYTASENLSNECGAAAANLDFDLELSDQILAESEEYFM